MTSKLVPNVMEERHLRLLATSELEQILCSSKVDDTLSRIMLPASDAWSVRFTDLASLPTVNGDRKPLSICIATEDIVGPVRNGGIGTTYAALAEALARANFETRILYLRGQDVETGSLEHWVEHYAAMGVQFVPVPNYAVREGFRSTADRWLRAPYNMLRYLLEHPADVVHVSEWRGSGYLSLLAKRQGLAFQDTLFIVKTSSPWMWNRLYSSRPLERIEDLAKIYAERRSVELADIVVGGSLHLLRWMLSQGYELPRTTTFVQPNFVRFDHLRDLLNKRSLAVGSRLPIQELVFFGRLEARKGLFTFCEAIRRLLRQGATLPGRITFMGKPGAVLTARPEQPILDFIRQETRDWPTHVEILTDFQQQQAIEYLLSGNRLAVMPSVIENSSMAVYEAAICGIPFVASSVGGTPELIRDEDKPFVLCEPHPIPLADLLNETLKLGGYIAAPSFENSENIKVWMEFHESLANGLKQQLSRFVPHQADTERVPITVCIYHTGDIDLLETTFHSIQAQDLKAHSVLVAVDAPTFDAIENVRQVAAHIGITCQVIETFDEDVGLSFNTLAQLATGELLLFIWEGTTLLPPALAVLERISALTSADLLNFFYRETVGDAEQTTQLRAPIIGSVTESFFRTDVSPQPLLVRRACFSALGGFTTDYRVLGYDHEFIARAQLSGCKCETALTELASVPSLTREWLHAKCYDVSVGLFRAIRPQLASTPLAMRDLLLMAKGAAAKAGVAKSAPAARKTKKSANIAPARTAGIDLILAGALAREELGIKNQARSPAISARSPRKEEGGGKQAVALTHLISVLESTMAEEPAGVGDGSRRIRSSNAVMPKPSDSAQIASISQADARQLYVHDGVAHGWAQSSEDILTPVIVEAMCEGRVVASCAADKALKVPAHMLKRVGPRAKSYELPLFPKWLPNALQKGSRIFDIRIRGTKRYLARSVEIFAPGATIDSSDFQGFCDPSDDGAVIGWAWDAANPDKKVDVAVFLNGAFLGRARADQYRQDLGDNGIGDGEHGFRLPFSHSVSKGGQHIIDVVIASNGLRLKRSPARLVGRRVVVDQARPWRLERLVRRT